MRNDEETLKDKDNEACGAKFERHIAFIDHLGFLSPRNDVVFQRSSEPRWLSRDSLADWGAG